MPITPKVKRIGHVVLYVRDPEKSARWYGEILGMKISARVAEGPYAGGIFLSFGYYDHDIALFPGGTDAPKGKEFEHIGLEIDVGGDIGKLKDIYATFLEKGVVIHEVLDHGVSNGIYFYDPDGHQLEVFAQIIPPDNGAAIAELGANQGQADLITFDR
ncbi:MULTISPECIES: VOC family protein [Nitrospirillum]|uniref:Glyoxalase n=2 Tax=Nitrospirillum TaxID=1543705 RepID=A0A248JUE7_9PROT|nr:MULTISPECIES: VOC family protein [Nitrospirillum]ASG22325.1 glyoxalase [Nitrospirillum amazonense CBAmc]MEA1674614.1 VOC family protein [Nitrospirillum sp. BR 11163]TWB43145.1 catechol 2,3-dioxygenase-like lactoylglutathione lyase family enzyme [Nitrospirillum amazonense]TWB64386.1 catechol 2,3-dioxygenase-like lactoylglutathione lyase family enzyme [Nitrospirillum amazonense]